MKPRLVVEGLKLFFMPWLFPSKLSRAIGCLAMTSVLLCGSSLLPLPAPSSTRVRDVGIMLLIPTTVLSVIQEVRARKHTKQAMERKKLAAQVYLGHIDIESLSPEEQENVKIELLWQHQIRKTD